MKLSEKISCDVCPYGKGCNRLIDASQDDDPYCDGVDWWLSEQRRLLLNEIDKLKGFVE